MAPLKKKREKEVAQQNTTTQRNTIVLQILVRRRELHPKKGSSAAIDISTLPRMLKTLCNTMRNVDKVHQEPQKIIIDLNIVLCEDNTGAKTLWAYIVALLSVP